MAIELNRDNFESEVLQSKKPVMVDFWGPQCQPCLALMPIVEKLEKDYLDRLKVTKVNTTQNRMLCAKLRILGLPAYLFYKDGKEINRLAGSNINKSDLVKAIDTVLA